MVDQDTAAPTGPATAPPVAAVVVTHDPGPHLEGLLASLGAQDYPALSVLVLDAASAEDPVPRVAAVLPSAFVRRLDDAPGYPRAANQVLDLVEGAAFYLFLHDDVRLAPDAVRLMVEEAFRSNAGVVGPKLVAWGAPEQLLQVGMSADKAGTPAPLVEPGELDHEQHDVVRDVLWIPGACTLVRSDLFRGVGGFDAGMTFPGEDLDLCWRVQVAGARVVVAPDARVEHHVDRDETTESRRRRRGARHRLRTVLKCYSLPHLVRVLPQAALFSGVESVYDLAMGRPAEARDVAGAWVWNLRRLRSLRGQRRAVRALRRVPDREVRRLQVGGSARLSGVVRGELHAEDRLRALAGAGRGVGDELHQRGTQVALAAGVFVALVFVIGTRHLVGDGVPAVGTIAPLPGVGGLFDELLAGWRAVGVGGAGPAPAAIALLGALGTLLFGATGLLGTVLTVGMVPLGALGAWRLARPVGSVRVRAAAAIVAATLPIAGGAFGGGRWGALLLTGAAPWLLASVARATGLPPFDERTGSTAGAVLRLGLLLAVLAAFVPAAALAAPLIAVAVLVGSVVAGGARPAVRGVVVALGAAGVALVLNLPYLVHAAGTVSWWGLGGVAAPAVGADLVDVVRGQVGPVVPSLLAWGTIGAAVLPLLLGSGWRAAWAARVATVAVACWLLAWAAGRGWLGEGAVVGDVLVPVAGAAVAFAVALGVAAFEHDLPGRHFGWRQVAAVAAAVAVVLGVAPSVAAAADGRWGAPSASFADALSFVGDGDEEGAARVLWVGDPAALPLSSWPLGGGLAYAASMGAPEGRDLWAAADRDHELLAEAVRVAAAGRTVRLGRLLAPLGVRYVAVPSRPAPARTQAPELPVPPALVDALGAQLDLRQVELDPALDVWENVAWAPVRASVAAGSVPEDGPPLEAAAATDMTAAEPALTGAAAGRNAAGALAAGGLHVAVPDDARRSLRVDGEAAPRRPGFGWALGFDAGDGGRGRLEWGRPTTHLAVVGGQLLGWAAVVVLAVRLRPRPEAPGAGAGPTPPVPGPASPEVRA